MSSPVTTKASSDALEKVKPPGCGGNACPHCAKCYDWRYVGNIDRDYECFRRDESHAIMDENRWHRRPNGPPVTCSYFYGYHFGALAAHHGFDICRCSQLKTD